MSGNGLTRRLRKLDLESSEELEVSANPSPPKSPTKPSTKTKSSVSRSSAFHPYNLSASSAKEAASSAFHPYNLSASGPGGLTTMLKNLRNLRDASRTEGLSGGQISEDLTNEANPSTSNKFEKSHDATYEDKKICDGIPSWEDLSDLERRIIRQVEYYFGDYNLPKDKWMKEKLSQLQDGWFDMDTMMTFPRLRSLTQNPNIVLTSLAKSPNDVLQVENWGSGRGRIRRNPNKPLPELNEARQIAVQERTLFVWGFDRATSLDELIDFFETEFPNVVNMRQRTAISDDDEKKREFIGSVFVTFGTLQDAENFFELRRELVFKDGRKLSIKWKREYDENRIEFNDEFIEESIEKTVFVQGFDKLETPREELVEFLKRFEGPVGVRKRVYRFGKQSDWQFSGGVFVSFDTRYNALRFMSKAMDQTLFYNEDKLSVKWAIEFYEKIGKFRRERATLKASKAKENEDHYMDEA